MPLALMAFWACAAACAIAHVGILRSVLRRADAVSPDVPRPRLMIEVLWAVVPMAVLAAVLLVTYPRVRAHAYAHDMGPMPMMEPMEHAR
jgi:hypothetical protein